MSEGFLNIEVNGINRKFEMIHVTLRHCARLLEGGSAVTAAALRGCQATLPRFLSTTSLNPDRGDRDADLSSFRETCKAFCDTVLTPSLAAEIDAKVHACFLRGSAVCLRAVTRRRDLEGSTEPAGR